MSGQKNPSVVALKTLVITFNDDSPAEDIEDIRSYLLHYIGPARFTVEEGSEFVELEGENEQEA